MTNPKKSRVWFWVIDTSFLCVFLFWMIASSRLLMYGAPWAVSSLWVVSLLLLVPALIFLQQASIERSVGQLAEVVVSIAIAFAVGIIVVGSENHAKPPMDMFKEEPIKAVTVAIVVFAITDRKSTRLNSSHLGI